MQGKERHRKVSFFYNTAGTGFRYSKNNNGKAVGTKEQPQLDAVFKITFVFADSSEMDSYFFEMEEIEGFPMEEDCN